MFASMRLTAPRMARGRWKRIWRGGVGAPVGIRVEICQGPPMTGEAPAGQDLCIRLLGRLELHKRGQAVALPASKKSRALLAYLVATTRPHLRDRLCELLWEA